MPKQTEREMLETQLWALTMQALQVDPLGLLRLLARRLTRYLMPRCSMTDLEVWVNQLAHVTDEEGVTHDG